MVIGADSCRFEEGILDTIRMNVIGGNEKEERIKRLKLLLLQLGVAVTNRQMKNMDLSKVIEGISGAESSVYLIYKLTKFVWTTQQTREKAVINAEKTLSAFSEMFDNMCQKRVKCRHPIVTCLESTCQERS